MNEISNDAASGTPQGRSHADYLSLLEDEGRSHADYLPEAEGRSHAD